jgi:hypothetical protein
VTVTILAQREKHSSPIVRTAEGIQMDKSDKQPENVDLLRNDSFESGSNVTIERLEHSPKQSLSMSSTEAGMQIDESAEQA